LKRIIKTDIISITDRKRMIEDLEISVKGQENGRESKTRIVNSRGVSKSAAVTIVSVCEFV